MLIFPLFSQFLGNTEVEAPKGTEVVKDAVRKLKVSQLQPGGWGLDWEAEKVEVIDALIPSSSVPAKVALHGCLYMFGQSSPGWREKPIKWIFNLNQKHYLFLNFHS